MLCEKGLNASYLVEKDGEKVDCALTVRITTRALKAEYSLFGIGKGTTYYAGAEVQGTVTYSLKNGRVVSQRDFLGVLRPPSRLRDSAAATKPADAPYCDALCKSWRVYIAYSEVVAKIVEDDSFAVLRALAESGRPTFTETAKQALVVQLAAKTVQERVRILEDSANSTALRAAAARSLAFCRLVDGRETESPAAHKAAKPVAMRALKKVAARTDTPKEVLDVANEALKAWQGDPEARMSLSKGLLE
jgi:hypothetical protein